MSTATQAPRGIALHIGVNFVDGSHYKGWEGPLSSCENDADTMLGITRRCGFEASQLKTADATRDRVSQAITDAAQRLAPGGLFLVSYSGHGGQVLDLDGDEADGKDDTWCLYDGQLLDDELHVLLASFKPGCRVLVISDSCHSGTLLKGPATDRPAGGARIKDDFIYPRAMPRRAAIDVSRAQRSFYADIQRSLPRPPPRITAAVRLLSGCQEHEQSFGNEETGRFTAAVKTVFADGAFKGDYQQFHAEIVQAVALAMNPQTPNHMVIGATDRDFDRQAPFAI